MVHAMRADTSFCVSTCAPAPEGSASTAASVMSILELCDIHPLPSLPQLTGAASLLRNPGALDHSGPFGDIGHEPFLQLPRRACLRLDAEIGVALLHLGYCDDLVNGGIERVDDIGRSSRADEYPVPGHHLVAGNAGFRDGRDAGQKRRALTAGNRHCAALPLQ